MSNDKRIQELESQAQMLVDDIERLHSGRVKLPKGQKEDYRGLLEALALTYLEEVAPPSLVRAFKMLLPSAIRNLDEPARLRLKKLAFIGEAGGQIENAPQRDALIKFEALQNADPSRRLTSITKPSVVMASAFDGLDRPNRQTLDKWRRDPKVIALVEALRATFAK